MRYQIITGNPKQSGLCYSIQKQVENGAKAGGATVCISKTNNIGRCQVCDDGWGLCRDSSFCTFGRDGFAQLQSEVQEADLICIITPVYWAEVEESLKGFLDRLRRCEFNNGALSGKPVLLIASAGGSGNGVLTCIDQLDRFCRHTDANIFDCISINRWNCDYKGIAAYEAAKAMAKGRKPGVSIG
ncbi:MAG: flavodoxin family protein [Eubacteriaceae bacterium]|nr:flavodoxin family protein [Eubacteriaceae bacterium]